MRSELCYWTGAADEPANCPAKYLLPVSTAQCGGFVCTSAGKEGGMNTGLQKRAVITGLGVVSAAGVGKYDFWDAIQSGKNCISEITRIDTSELEIKIAGEIKTFSPADCLHGDLSETTQRVTLFASYAAQQAIQDSGIGGHMDPDRAGICLGTSAGGLETTVGRLLERLRHEETNEEDTAIEL